MSMNVFVKPLLNVELFQGLRPLQITEIARRADRIVYRAGDVIIKRGTPGDAAVLIISGAALRLAHATDEAASEEFIPAGSLLGEMAMLIETDYSATIVAQNDVRALRINRSELHAQMTEDNSLADHLVVRIAARLNSIAMALRSIDASVAGTPSTLASRFPFGQVASAPVPLH